MKAASKRIPHLPAGALALCCASAALAQKTTIPIPESPLGAQP